MCAEAPVLLGPGQIGSTAWSVCTERLNGAKHGRQKTVPTKLGAKCALQTDHQW